MKKCIYCLLGLLLAGAACSCRRDKIKDPSDYGIELPLLGGVWGYNLDLILSGNFQVQEPEQVLSYGICWSADGTEPDMHRHSRLFLPADYVRLGTPQSWLVRQILGADEGIIPGASVRARAFVETADGPYYGPVSLFQVPDKPVLTDLADIPIVFHILYEDEKDKSTNIPASSLPQDIGDVNAVFHSNGSGAENSVRIGVNFVLAQTRPDGSRLAEQGVNRVYFSGSGSLSPGAFLAAAPTGEYAALLWDPDRYLNVWVFPGDKEQWITGVLPYVPETAPLGGLQTGDYYLHHSPEYMHGMYMASRVFGNNVFSDPDRLARRCHELGHMLGLLDAFSYGCGGEGDYCDDTPDYDRERYENSISRFMYSRISCEGEEFESVNVMDEAYSRSHTFTPQQRARVEHILRHGILIPGYKDRERQSAAAVSATSPQPQFTADLSLGRP